MRPRHPRRRRAATAAGPKRRARRILPRLSRGLSAGPRGSQPHIKVALRAFRLGLFWLDPPAVSERASQKSSLGLLWLGAGQRVGGGWFADHGDCPD